MDHAELAKHLTVLQDIEAIKQLKAEYCDICDDDHNQDRIVSIFAEDGVWEGKGVGYAKGHAELRKLFKSFQERISFSQHNVFNPRITVNGNEARGVFTPLSNLGRQSTAGLDLPLFTAAMQQGERVIPEGEIDPFRLNPPHCRKPVVFAVKGWCLTLGIELMLAGDIVVAASDTRFGQIEIKRGIMPTGGALIRMVERAGWGNAMRYLLTGDEFDASTAHRLGMVQEIVLPGEELDRALAIAERIAAQAPLAVQASLASSRRYAEHGPAAAIAEYETVQRRLAQTEDAAEGVAAFRERRAPRFMGR